jgi:hypothetical protein
VGLLLATQRLGLEEHVHLLVDRQAVGLQKTGLQHVIRKIFRNVIHHVHDLVHNLLRHGRKKKIESPPLRDDRLLLKLAFSENKPGRRPGHTERQQDDRLLL